MRVTWHKDTSTMVCSHWQGDVCLASTQVSLENATRLIGLVVEALKDAAARPATAGPPSQRRTPLDQLLARLRPQLAQIIKLTDRFRDNAPAHQAAPGS
jgi:hypothetical protein